MLTVHQIMHFCDTLSHFNKVSIEENLNGENVTFENICKVNTGNNCLHFQIIHNNHRIVIQTHKFTIIPDKPFVDIVQGKPELEEDFIDFIDYLNFFRKDFSDQKLNELFVFYCGMWQKCTMFWQGEMDSLYWEFGPYLSITWADNKWFINTCDANISQVNFILNFIKTIEEICR